MNLALLQELLVASIAEGKPFDARLLRTIQSSTAIGARSRLDVYRSNVRGAHLLAIDQAYPVTREVLGPRYWEHLLTTGIQAFGSGSPDLNTYGCFIPHFLRTLQRRRPELEGYDYLYDLARLEWRAHRIEMAPDDLAMPWSDVLALGADVLARCKPKLSRALSIFRSPFPVDVIWCQHRRHPAAQADDPGRLVVCCVHRTEGFRAQVTRLDEQSAWLIAGIRRGMTLQQMQDSVAAVRAATLPEKLAQWIRCGWIIGFDRTADDV